MSRKKILLYHLCYKNDKINDKINDIINDKIKAKTDEMILSLILENAYITINELAEKIGKSNPTIHRHMNKLVSERKIERVGSRKSGYWRVLG